MLLSFTPADVRTKLCVAIAMLLVTTAIPAHADDCRLEVIGPDQDPLVGPGSAPGQVLAPAGIVVDPTGFGDFLVADSGNHRIQRFSAAGHFLSSFGSFGREPGQFDTPTDIVIGPDDFLYVADSGNDRIQVFTRGGAFVRSFGEPGQGMGQFDDPWFLDVGDQVWVSDRGNRRVQVFTREGALVRVIGGSTDENNPFLEPSGVTIRYDDSILVGDRLGSQVHLFSAEGQFLESISLAGTMPLSVRDTELQSNLEFVVADGASGDLITVYPPDLACPWPVHSHYEDAEFFDYTGVAYCCYAGLATDRAGNRIILFFFPDPVLPTSWGAIKARADH